MNYIGLIVRCKDEPYVTEFVHYYIQQGIDKIYIIDDNSNTEIYTDVIHNERVSIVFNDTTLSQRANTLYEQIQHDYEWIIYVDIDEYIVTKQNKDKTIKEELETTFKDSMCIKIPWVMMSCNSIQHNPPSLLKTNIYRWDHDKKHINTRSDEPKFRCRYDAIEVKCIFKPRFFNGILDHHPILPTCVTRIVESITNTEQHLDPFYTNLREKDISEGYLLCYHYRIISVENCLNKIKRNIWYKNYTLNDLLSNDYPEIIDETLNRKSALYSPSTWT
jgi:hypothetical protein